MFQEPIELSPSVQENLLARALADADLRDRLAPVVALEFGVVPVAFRDRVLLVACRPDFAVRNFAALEQITGNAVRGLTFDPQVLFRFLRAIARLAERVNFPTFTAPGFLDDPKSVEELAREKVEPGIEPSCALPADRVVLIDIDYHSMLVDLDMAVQTPYQSPQDVEIPQTGEHDLALPFTRHNGHTRLHTEGALGDAVVIARRFYAQEGAGMTPQFGVDGGLHTEVLVVFHATEVQLTQIDEAGRCLFHVYDHETWVDPGELRDFYTKYYFLAEGHRFERTLRIKVRSMRCEDKARVELDAGEGEFGEEELARWLSTW